MVVWTRLAKKAKRREVQKDSGETAQDGFHSK